MKAADRVPATAPKVLIAYNMPIRGPSWASLRTTYLANNGRVAPIIAVGGKMSAKAETRPNVTIGKLPAAGGSAEPPNNCTCND